MSNTATTRPAALRGRWLIAGIIIVAAAIAAAVALAAPTRAQTTAPEGVAVTTGTIVATTSGSGTIAAAQSVTLSFTSAGAVAEVLVEEGQAVQAGQPLARLDTRDLELQVASAEARLRSAQLRLEQSGAGNATDETLAAQRAQVASAEAQLASAEAQLRSAQAQLRALRSPSASDIEAAELKVRTAELDLQSLRDSKSAAKSRAELEMARATQTLTQAQSAYSTALQSWEYVRETGNDPQSPTKVVNGKAVDNKLSDAQRQAYYDKFVQSEAALRSAEAALQQAQLSYDQARQDEATGVQQAEVKLADARRALAALRSPDADNLVRQQAAVDQAGASADQARAGLAQAQANLAKLSAPATASDQAIQRASVAEAEQALAQARLRLEQATLTAPFDGVVSEVGVVAGAVATSATPAIRLVDRSALHVDLRLSENDVATVSVGQPVALTIDALRGWSSQGQVAYIAPAADEQNGVVTYRVRVDLTGSDPRALVGMTASLQITTATREGALLVPTSALLPSGSGRVVQRIAADGSIASVPVEIGLTDGAFTEITAGLRAGELVVAAPGAARQPAAGLFGS